jgi:hypothetical protein
MRSPNPEHEPDNHQEEVRNMAVTPKENLDKITVVTNAWETLRPEKTFSGMTLAQFKARIRT